MGAPFVIVERVHGEGETTFFSYSDGPIQYCSPQGISTAKSYSNCRDGKIKGGDGMVRVGEGQGRSRGRRFEGRL